MSMQDIGAAGDRLRRLAAFAGLSLSNEEIDRLTPLQEFLVAAFQRLHSVDYGEREPLVLHRPNGGAGNDGR